MTEHERRTAKQEKINSFRAAFVDLAAAYVARITRKMDGNVTYTPEMSGGPFRWGMSLADEVRVANLLAATIEKMQKDGGGELPLARSEDGERHTAADNLDFLRGVLEGRVPVPEGTVFNVNVSTGDGAAVQLKLKEDGKPEPPDGEEIEVNLGAGATFRLENASASGPCATWAENKTDTLLTLKELSRWFNSRANSGDYRQKRYVEVLEFAISVLSELREIKEVHIPAEPNTPGAWELMRDILAGRRPAPEGTVFDVVIDLTGNPLAIRNREEPGAEAAPRVLEIKMPGGEAVKLNSAAEAYRLAGCIEEMAARVWPEVKPDALQDGAGQ